jgi:hypothetical protein
MCPRIDHADDGAGAFCLVADVPDTLTHAVLATAAARMPRTSPLMLKILDRNVGKPVHQGSGKLVRKIPAPDTGVQPGNTEFCPELPVAACVSCAGWAPSRGGERNAGRQAAVYTNRIELQLGGLRIRQFDVKSDRPPAPAPAPAHDRGLDLPFVGSSRCWHHLGRVNFHVAHCRRLKDHSTRRVSTALVRTGRRYFGHLTTWCLRLNTAPAFLAYRARPSPVRALYNCGAHNT